MRKLAFMMVCISLLLTGCWDYQEVDRLESILAVGIDHIPGSKSILLTAQIAKPEKKGSSNQSGGQEGKAYTLMNSEGNTLTEAIRNLSVQSTRHILLSHCKTIVLGKEFAETGIGDVVDELKRDREFRRSDWIITTDETAKEILEMDIAMEQIPARGLDHILQIYQKEGNVLPINLNNFFARLNGVSHVSFAPLAQVEDIEKRVASQLEKSTGRTLESSEKPKTMIIERTAVYKDLRMVGVLNEEETKAHKWIIDTPKGTNVLLPYDPEGKTNEGQGEIPLSIIDGKVAITPHISEDGITMNIVMTSKVSIQELSATGVKVLDPKVIEQLQLQGAEKMKRELDQMITTAQKELKTDCIGFAESIHNYYPVEWKKIKNNWDDIFPTVDYHITCEVEILKTGLMGNPTLESELEE